MAGDSIRTTLGRQAVAPSSSAGASTSSRQQRRQAVRGASSSSLASRSAAGVSQPSQMELAAQATVEARLLTPYLQLTNIYKEINESYSKLPDNKKLELNEVRFKSLLGRVFKLGQDGLIKNAECMRKGKGIEKFGQIDLAGLRSFLLQAMVDSAQQLIFIRQLELKQEAIHLVKIINSITGYVLLKEFSIKNYSNLQQHAMFARKQADGIMRTTIEYDKYTEFLYSFACNPNYKADRDDSPSLLTAAKAGLAEAMQLESFINVAVYTEKEVQLLFVLTEHHLETEIDKLDNNKRSINHLIENYIFHDPDRQDEYRAMWAKPVTISALNSSALEHFCDKFSACAEDLVLAAAKKTHEFPSEQRENVMARIRELALNVPLYIKACSSFMRHPNLKIVQDVDDNIDLVIKTVLNDILLKKEIIYSKELQFIKQEENFLSPTVAAASVPSLNVEQKNSKGKFTKKEKIKSDKSKLNQTPATPSKINESQLKISQRESFEKNILKLAATPLELLNFVYPNDKILLNTVEMGHPINTAHLMRNRLKQVFDKYKNIGNISNESYVQVLSVANKAINDREADDLKKAEKVNTIYLKRLLELNQIESVEKPVLLKSVNEKNNDNLFEVTVRLKCFSNGKNAPLIYVHGHSKTIQSVESCLNAMEANFMALHLKNENQRGYGREEEEIYGLVVHRAKVDGALWAKLKEKMPLKGRRPL